MATSTRSFRRKLHKGTFNNSCVTACVSHKSRNPRKNEVAPKSSSKIDFEGILRMRSKSKSGSGVSLFPCTGKPTSGPSFGPHSRNPSKPTFELLLGYFIFRRLNLVARYSAILRYYSCYTPHSAIPFRGQLDVRYPPLILFCMQAKKCQCDRGMYGGYSAIGLPGKARAIGYSYTL